jgi:hypothetical protein
MLSNENILDQKEVPGGRRNVPNKELYNFAPRQLLWGDVTWEQDTVMACDTHGRDEKIHA